MNSEPANSEALTPVPDTQRLGRHVHPGVVVALAIVTGGLYVLFYWWRVSHEVGRLDSTRSAHRLMKIGILAEAIALAGLLAAIVAFASLVDSFAVGTLDSLAALGGLGLLGMAAFFLSVLLAAGEVTILVAQWRTLKLLRDQETSFGRNDRVRPGLYAFLPFGLSLGVFLPSIGVPFGMAGLGLTMFFMGQTQKHLNDLWRALPATEGPKLPE